MKPKPRAKCRGPHPLILVEEYTALGAWVRCLSCRRSFHEDEQRLQEHYYHFRHVSEEGPDGDIELFLSERILDEA